MDRYQLTSFVTLAEELHFSKAAAKLNITQPALSLQISRLETSLGVQLLNRNPKQVSLTDAGRVFLAETSETLRQMDRSIKLAKRAADGLTGRLSVAFVEATPYSILPKLMSAYSREQPDVMVTLQEMVSDHQTDAILSGKIDVGLLRPMGPPRGLERMALHSEPYVIALPKPHPLAKLDEIPISRLNGERLITTPPVQRRYIEGRLRPFLEKAGASLLIVQEVQQLHTAVGLVGAGLGIALVPESVMRLRMDNVVYRAFAEKDAPRAELHVAWRRENTSKTLERFLTITRQFIKTQEIEPKSKLRD